MFREKLERLYSKIPDARCKGLCQEACGPIVMSALEDEIIREKHGCSLHVDANLTCSALKDGKCSVYENRPLVCRAYGSVENLQCPHGCHPQGGLTPAREVEAVFKKVMDISKWRHVSTLPKDLADKFGLP